MNMKVTIIRDKGEREVVNREELISVAGLIQKGWREKSVLHLRELYHLITVERLEDGRVKTNLKGGIQFALPASSTTIAENGDSWGITGSW